jgi:hypothetical protein
MNEKVCMPKNAASYNSASRHRNDVLFTSHIVIIRSRLTFEHVHVASSSKDAAVPAPDLATEVSKEFWPV